MLLLLLILVLQTNALEEEGYRLVTIHFEPIGTHQILLIENCIIGAKESKVLKLKRKKIDEFNVMG